MYSDKAVKKQLAHSRGIAINPRNSESDMPTIVIPTGSNDYHYLASPYSHEKAYVREARFVEVCLAAQVLQQRGFVLYVPIMVGHPWATACNLDVGWETWGTWDETFLSKASSIIICHMPGSQDSVGIAAERDLMQNKYNKPVYHLGFINSFPLLRTNFVGNSSVRLNLNWELSRSEIAANQQMIINEDL
jgi:hypothetical protein